MKTNTLVWTKIFIALLLTSGKMVAQPQKFEIIGKLKGQHVGKIYLFFDNDYIHKDSISSEIRGGQFQFKGVASLPILARIHLAQNSYIMDVYMDSPRLLIDCSNTLELTNNKKDTLNQLTMVSSKGSLMEKDKWNFERWVSKLKSLKISEEEKRNLYFTRLSAFVKQHKKSKVSPYLIGKAEMLTFNQVSELSKIVDSSLHTTYEAKTIRRLLSSLDKSKYWKPGTMFYDVDLPDSSGKIFSTKDVRNKFTLYEFWASWCKPCRIEHPGLRDFYARNKNKGLEIVSISLDKVRKKWVDAIRKDKLPWIHLSDLTGFETELCQYYGIEAIPVSFFVDAGGKLIGANMSYAEMESAMAAAK